MISPAVPDPPELDHVLWVGYSIGSIGWDVGANCGQTVDRIHALAPDQVIAFEPAIEAYEYLVELMSPKRHWLNPANLAATDHDGTVDLIAAPSKISSGQLVTHGTEGMEWSDEEMADGVVRTVQALTLDTFAEQNPGCAPPSFIKIDVEGHEMAVLRGAKKILAEHKPEMLIEVHSKQLGDEIFVLLLAAGYRLEEVRHPHYAPGSTLWETHFWFRCFPKG